jgi:hypothetical protein
MGEGDETVFQEGLSAAIALLQKSGRSDYRWLNLAVTEAFTLIDGHFSIACSLESSKLVVRFCRRKVRAINDSFRNFTNP